MLLHEIEQGLCNIDEAKLYFPPDGLSRITSTGMYLNWLYSKSVLEPSTGKSVMLYSFANSMILADIPDTSKPTRPHFEYNTHIEEI